MPFGFWVLGNKHAVCTMAYLTPHGLKCLSAFGFWGTKSFPQGQVWRHNVSNAFRLLGSGEPKNGRWMRGEGMRVSNAFRLLGSGEQIIYGTRNRSEKHTVSNAFRLLGSGERVVCQQKPIFA